MLSRMTSPPAPTTGPRTPARLPPTLDELAQPQAGVVSRSQLLAAGWSSSAITRAVRSGRLMLAARGIYRTDGTPWTRRAAQHTALLVVGPGAVFGRWTAAALHGFTEPRPGPLDVIAASTRRAPRPNDDLLRLTRTRSLPPEHRCEVDGLPVTSGARTLLDLAATTATGELTELTAASLRLRACTLADLEAVLNARDNARGRKRLHAALEVLGDDGAVTRSDVEAGALRSLIEGGLPRPRVAFRVVDANGAFIAEVDLAYPEQRLAIEIDGFRWHSSPDSKRRDEERQNRLVLAGWTVLRFSASDVRARPHLLVDAVREALRRSGRPTDR